MNPTLKNNQRVTYLRDLPSAITLHAYIQKLDAKYNVKNPRNQGVFRFQSGEELVNSVGK